MDEECQLSCQGVIICMLRVLLEIGLCAGWIFGWFLCETPGPSSLVSYARCLWLFFHRIHHHLASRAALPPSHGSINWAGCISAGSLGWQPASLTKRISDSAAGFPAMAAVTPALALHSPLSGIWMLTEGWADSAPCLTALSPMLGG